MPAALVIRVSIAYIKVVAFQKLVVGFVVSILVHALSGSWMCAPFLGGSSVALSCRFAYAHCLL